MGEGKGLGTKGGGEGVVNHNGWVVGVGRWGEVAAHVTRFKVTNNTCI